MPATPLLVSLKGISKHDAESLQFSRDVEITHPADIFYETRVHIFIYLRLSRDITNI